MLTIGEIKKVVSMMGKKYNVKYIYLFGSYAKGRATEKSDVDIIVDMSNIHTYRDYFYFCEEIKEGLGTELDVTAVEGMWPGFYDLVKDDRILLYGS